MREYMHSPMQRIVEWRTFRESIQNDSPEKQLKDTVEYWKSVSIYPTSQIDIWKLEENPWDILYSGKFCESTISYMIYHTLLCIDHEYWSQNLNLVITYQDDTLPNILQISHDGNILNPHFNEYDDKIIVFQHEDAMAY